MIVDASALTAVLLAEPEAGELLRKLKAARVAATHPISVLEAAQAVARVKQSRLTEALLDIQEFLHEADMNVVTLGPDEARQAIEAAERYGKCRGHPAQLNMGDCLSYAVAKLRGMPLLYKGDDFAQTDLA